MHFYVYPDAALRANLIRALHSSFPHAIEPLHGLRVDSQWYASLSDADRAALNAKRGKRNKHV